MKITVDPSGDDGLMVIRADDEMLGVYRSNANGLCDYGVMSSLEGRVAPSIPAAIVAILVYTGILTTEATSESVH